MRNLITRAVLWLAYRLGHALIPQDRIPMGSDAQARSERWEQFAREEGGLYDMIEALRRETFEQAAETDPKDVERLQYAAMADRNLRRLKLRVDSVIATGKIEAKRQPTDLRIIKSA